MGNSFAHGTWIIVENNTPNGMTTSVSDFRFEEWGEWADRPDHKCDKREIKPMERMEELLRIARGVKSNKWTLTLAFSDGTKLVLRIDQRYVNMKVKHWHWIEGVNHPPFIAGGDEDLYKIDYDIDWPTWKIIISVRKKTEAEKEKENNKKMKLKEEVYINYFPEPEVPAPVTGKRRLSEVERIKVKSREREARRAKEKAETKLKEDEKRESRKRANMRMLEMESNWKDVKDVAYFLRSYPLVNYFAFLIGIYLFYFVMLFYFSILFNVSINVQHTSIEA